MNILFIEPIVLEKLTLQEIPGDSKRNKCYQKALYEIEDTYTTEDINKIICSSNLEEIYIRHMKDFNTEILYKSEGHGINHNIRVCFFAYIISTNEKLEERDFELIMEACKYHDIGRINDLEDSLHGKRSAESLNFLEDKYTEEELNYIKTIVTCHSLSDKEFEKIANKNRVRNLPRCKKMYEILKDSDGLDRVRLHYPYVNITYLRTNTSRRMIPFAHKLFYNYNSLLEKDKQKLVSKL